MANKKWTFSGFYPFQDPSLLKELSLEYNQPLFKIAEDVIGIILPYPHGFDDDYPLLDAHFLDYATRECVYLHIFNLGVRRENVVGVARCVKYETGLLPSMKRISFLLVPPGGE